MIIKDIQNIEIPEDYEIFDGLKFVTETKLDQESYDKIRKYLAKLEDSFVTIKGEMNGNPKESRYLVYNLRIVMKKHFPRLEGYIGCSEADKKKNDYEIAEITKTFKKDVKGLTNLILDNSRIF